VLQNESVDDGDEHFEDILENPEDSADDGHEKHNLDTAGGIDSVKQVKLVDKNNGSIDVSRQHALYDPRHREPSYWYCLFNLIFVHASYIYILVLCFVTLEICDCYSQVLPLPPNTHTPF
jgi:hypothetical protein